MRKTPKVRAKTLESELPLFYPKVGLNTILISNLEVGIDRRACPCTKIEIPLKSFKDFMLVSIPVSVVPVPKVQWYSNSLWVPVPLLHCSSLHVGTGTSQCGTGTTVSAAAPLQFRTGQNLPTASVIDNDDIQLSSGTKML